jgi:hypothetical protein
VSRTGMITLVEGAEFEPTPPAERTAPEELPSEAETERPAGPEALGGAQTSAAGAPRRGRRRSRRGGRRHRRGPRPAEAVAGQGG